MYICVVIVANTSHSSLDNSIKKLVHFCASVLKCNYIGAVYVYLCGDCSKYFSFCGCHHLSVPTVRNKGM